MLISRNGADVLRTGFGKANLATGEMNATDTRFRIGSVSKTLTGMGVIQLLRDGLLTNLDQPLSDFDVAFPLGNQITVRHLLTHQSGIPDYVGAFEGPAKSGESFTPEDIYEVLAASIAENGLNFTPGTLTQYSNSNFLIAALLIQELSGTTYHDYIKQNVLIPLGMNDTEVGTNDIPGVGYAQGYHNGQNASSYPMSLAFGAGDWTSTVNDLEKWCAAAMGATWFTPAEKEMIFGGEVPAEATVFGLAWFKSNIGGRKFYWHGGDIDGFSALIGFVPASNSILIALSNEQDDTAATRNAIIETIVKEEL